MEAEEGSASETIRCSTKTTIFIVQWEWETIGLTKPIDTLLTLSQKARSLRSVTNTQKGGLEQMEQNPQPAGVLK